MRNKLLLLLVLGFITFLIYEKYFPTPDATHRPQPVSSPVNVRSMQQTKPSIGKVLKSPYNGKSLSNVQRAELQVDPACLTLWEDPCLSSIISYRCQITDWLTRDQKTEDIQDPRVVYEKIFAMAQTPKQKNYKRLASLVERAQELTPDLPGNGKMAVVTKIAEANQEHDPDLRAALFRNLDAAVDLALLSSPEDKELAEASLYIKSKGLTDMEALESQANRLAQSPSFQALGNYYLAATSWRSKYLEKTRDYLRKAIEIDPMHPRFQKTLDALGSAELGQPGLFDFKLTTTLNFDLGD
ncbi:hypothetical protein WDW86_03245 [Bdellovibrionota bacterium FG-2]